MIGLFLASAGAEDASIWALVMGVLNLGVLVAVGAIAWSLRRLIGQNDETHRQLGGRIDTLSGAIESEREARHQFHRELDDRVWSVSGDVKENYQTRREGLRLFGSLSQKIDNHHRELLGKLDALPCRSGGCTGRGNDE